MRFNKDDQFVTVVLRMNVGDANRLRNEAYTTAGVVVSAFRKSGTSRIIVPVEVVSIGSLPDGE